MNYKFFSLAVFCLAATFGFAQNVEETFSIIKPEAVEKNALGGIISYIERSGLKVIAIKMVRISQQEAEKFYEVHKERPFYSQLVNYMSSGPIVVMVLEGKDAVVHYRKVMGPTDPSKAEAGTIRADFGANITQNAVHGSDSIENAQKEIAFFFKPSEIFSRLNFN